MSLFIRSLSGLRNYGIFTKKEVTAFCEGGSQFVTVEDALNGNATDSAEDISFWQTVCNACGGGRTFHIKAVGNRHAISSIAKHVVENDIKGVCVFADRYWLNYTSEAIVDQRVIYTPHYSWENTVIRPDVIADATLAVGYFGQNHHHNVKNEASHYLQRLMRALKWPLYLDISSFGSGASFIDKTEACGGAIKVADSGELLLDRSKLVARVRNNKQSYKRLIEVKMKNILSQSDTPGHVLMGAGVGISKSYVKRNGNRVINSSTAKSALLQAFRSAFVITKWRKEFSYFSACLAKVPNK